MDILVVDAVYLDDDWMVVLHISVVSVIAGCGCGEEASFYLS